jgi:hypothetical protein
MKNKKVKNRRVLKANSIILSDDEGRPRIILDAGGGKIEPNIVLLGRDDKSIQISSQPNGGIGIMVLGRHCTSHISIGLWPDERGTIEISNTNGKLGTVLGQEPDTSTHRLMLFKNGNHFWNTPTGRTDEQEGGQGRTAISPGARKKRKADK